MTKKRFFRIFQLVANDTAEFFPYFFVFYIICLLMSLFNESWYTFFYWPAFHIFTVLFALTALFSETVRGPIGKNIKRSKRTGSSALHFLVGFVSFFIYLALSFFYRVSRLFKKVYLLIAKKLTKKNIFKIIVITVVLVFVLYKNIGPLDSIIILYVLVAIFFLIDFRISAGIALILLAICPIVLIFKEDGFAELSAIYAYYFLVITVVSQIKEVFLDGKNKKIRW